MCGCMKRYRGPSVLGDGVIPDDIQDAPAHHRNAEEAFDEFNKAFPPSDEKNGKEGEKNHPILFFASQHNVGPAGRFT